MLATVAQISFNSITLWHTLAEGAVQSRDLADQYSVMSIIGRSFMMPKDLADGIKAIKELVDNYAWLYGWLFGVPV